jgi:hypothetical protein
MEVVKQKPPNPHLEGYTKCKLCGRLYEIGTQHPCFAFHDEGGRRKQGWNEKRRIKEHACVEHTSMENKDE